MTDWPTVPAPGSVPNASIDDRDRGALLGNLRNGAWLDAQEFAPLNYAVPGLFPEGFVLHVGAPKIGKSAALLDVALAVASGGCAFGCIRVAERDVLLLALEDGDRRMQDRCRRLLGMFPIPKRLNYLTAVATGQAVPTVEAWLDQADDPGLVIIDTLGRVMPPALPGESAYQRDYRVGARLKRIADDRPGLSLIVNHHDRKAAADDFVDSVNGTHGLAGAADTIAVLTRPRQEQEGVLRITGRDVPEGEYALVFTGAAWTLDGRDLAAAAAKSRGRAATAGLGDRSADVIRFVTAAENEDGVRASDVEQALDLPDARRYLARLVASGRLTRLARGVYGGPSSTPVPTVPVSQEDAPTIPLSQVGGVPLERDNGTVGTALQEER